MTPAIRVEGLSKMYRIDRAAPRGCYRTLRESLVEATTAPLGRLQRSWAGDRTEEFWALRGVDFEVMPGEVVGIIGHNGAGKSTLLKILSRITKPSGGRAELRGRLGSLLEVGTGFHPELTGRENVFLNGSILGMSRREIAARFDEIVAFAEVESFIDTPVKRYSSGMYVRLAFSVAAHLEPEILLVDEVLAVGDSRYQQRCVDRMSEIANSGRTILLVSHNMDLIPRLCERAIVLDHGRVAHFGRAEDAIQKYLGLLTDTGPEGDLSGKPRTGTGVARFTRLRLVDPAGNPKHVHRSGEDLILEMEVESTADVADVELAVALSRLGGGRFATSWTRESGDRVSLRRGTQAFRCRFRDALLRPGHRISASPWMSSGEVIDAVENARIIEIADGDGTQYLSSDKYQGIVVLKYDWERVGDATAGWQPSGVMHPRAEETVR